MKTKKDILRLPLICILILSMLLAACGGSGGETTTPSSDPADHTQSTDATDGEKDPTQSENTEATDTSDPEGTTNPDSTEGTEMTEPSQNTDPSEESTEPSSGETTPPATNPPATDPCETNPPATNPPATDPSETNPPATNPPATNPSETNPPATEHSHKYDSQVTAPTCTAEGYTTYVCGCGHSYTANKTAATGHSYKVETIAPTSNAEGYDLHTCTKCNDSYKDNYKDKLPSGSQTEEVTYTITVVDTSGNPIKNMIVKCGDKINVTNASGVATFKLPKGSYYFTLNYPDESVPFYDSTKAIVTPATPSVTITATEMADDCVVISAPSLKGSEYTEHMAYIVKEGENFATLVAGDMTYFIFTPTRPGYFKVSVNSNSVIDLGFYGGPMYVMRDKALTNNSDGSVTLEIHGYHIGSETTQTTQFVLGVKTADGKAADCVMNIVRTGDVPITPEDVTWTVAKAEEKYLVKYDSGKSQQPVPIMIDTVKLSDITKGDDGYYYYKGNLLLIRIDSASEYLASFTEICDTSTLGVYYYKENGEFDYKLRFNEMIAEYAEVCDSNGVCPLNDQLMKMVKDVGEFKYWWDKEANKGYIFGDKTVNPETAWLFACCYYA